MNVKMKDNFGAKIVDFSVETKLNSWIKKFTKHTKKR